MNNQKQKDLGIFYTPKIVVDFIFQMLHIMKNKEDEQSNRWQSHKPLHNPSVIDPACGEGIFLKTALEKEFTKADWVFGLDIDEQVVKKWPEINLLKEFNHDLNKLQAHFFHQNGLDKIHWEQHKDKFYKKLKQEDIKNEKFDVVVGNPPYGGTGIDDLNTDLEKSLFDFEIWKRSFRKNDKQIADNLGLFGNGIKASEITKLKKFPIEILFLDKFIQLAKADGFIAIIIPDGILANSTYHYVRQFLAEKTKVTGIISLPRETFKLAGTNAKTSILILEKQKMADLNYPVFLASTENLSQGNFDTIITKFKEFYDKQ